MTELPYSVEVLAAVLGDFNRTWWPAVLAGLIASVWIMLALARTGDTGLGQKTSRYVCFAVAGMSLAVGGPFLLGTMAALDFMAPAYALLWLANAVVFLILGMRGRIRFASPMRRHRPPVAIVAFAAIYPMLFWLETDAPPLGFALPGSAPEPTAILIVGLMSAIRGRLPVAAAAVPLVWAAVAGFNGYLLDLFTPFAVAVTLLAALAARAVMAPPELTEGEKT